MNESQDSNDSSTSNPNDIRQQEQNIKERP